MMSGRLSILAALVICAPSPFFDGIRRQCGRRSIRHSRDDAYERWSIAGILGPKGRPQ